MFLTVQIYSTGNFRIQLTGLFISIAAILVSQILFDIRNFQRVGTVLGQMEFAITATLNCTDISITAQTSDLRCNIRYLLRARASVFYNAILIFNVKLNTHLLFINFLLT